MNYAARVFVKRNGLKNLNDGNTLDRIKGILKEDEGDKISCCRCSKKPPGRTLTQEHR